MTNTKPKGQLFRAKDIDPSLRLRKENVPATFTSDKDRAYFLDLISSMLHWDPRLRPTAYELQKHPFLVRIEKTFPPRPWESEEKKDEGSGGE